MKNTLAVMLLALGGILIYAGYKGWTFSNTIRFFTGQELQKVQAKAGDLTGKDDDLNGNPDKPKTTPDVDKLPLAPGGELNPNAPGVPKRT